MTNIIDLNKPHSSREIRQFIDRMMANHNSSECCNKCRSFCKIYNSQFKTYDRGYCENQSAEMCGSGFVDLTDWCLHFQFGEPLECPESENVNDFIILHADYFNLKG